MKESYDLNAICPYFTMFPLEFPHKILRAHAKPGEIVLDPFCGRGTTNYASRFLGLSSVGIDSSKVATAITKSKLVTTSPEEITKLAKSLLASQDSVGELPSSEFWKMMYQKDVLLDICRIREALLKNCSSQSRQALRGIMLGALHGPIPKTKFSYFSNQSPRTYSPKPAYSIKFWEARNMTPPKMHILDIIRERAERYYQRKLPIVDSKIILGDSRKTNSFSSLQKDIKWIITSPPYFGMSTYIQDQWLRYWFLGGPEYVDYSIKDQLGNQKKDKFVNDLGKVWNNILSVCSSDAKLIIRFGTIRSRYVEFYELLRSSIAGSGWKIIRVDSAGTSNRGRRQAETFLKKSKHSIKELDIWAEPIH